MIKVFAAWLMIIAVFLALLAAGGAADKSSCKRIGMELGAKSALIDGRCIVDGFGRVN